jgi:hypothetical protein
MNISTLYSEVYENFLEKVTDYGYISLTDAEIDAQLKIYLKSAIQKFLNYCEQDLTNRSDTTATFNITLTDEEIEILAMFMVLGWLNPQVNSQQLLKEKFGNRDYNLFSSSNLLKEMKDLKKEITGEVNDMLTVYYYASLS